MDNQIVTGILSYGMSGRVFHAPFIDTHAGFKLHAVTERSQKRAVERYPDIISYNSVEELLADEAIELVIVNTPNHTHFEYAKKALEAKKHVLVEKPFAASSAEAEELFQLGRKNGCKVLVYQNRRWDSDFQSVKSVIESGELGRLIEVNFRFDRFKKDISHKYFKEERLPASGLLYDLGPHVLDQAISIFGRPLSYTKTLGTFRPGSQVDDYFHLHLKYPEGLNVFITSGLLITHPVPSYVVHGTRGSYLKKRTDVQEEQLEKAMSPLDPDYGIEPDGSEGLLATLNDAGQKSLEYKTALKGNYSRLFDAVHQCIRDDQAFPVSEEDILCQLQILENK
ncbi:Gfo/Idh/MocA family oxidoreductase [Pedobacter sp. SYSU D00535]|uniref:Gfo/Idh/MocA family oxidoreductase n=1 Tax=Pedobacter sp. SYSU D00535 TaxID=2810308 RepID=UPI001A9606BB|nr:Gfo/Idh/MocA family oxidoreductase [Pedobacter sp. SYSU D00535]